MFDRYYCIKTNCDTWKFEENDPVNLYFLRLKARGNGTFTACVLKTPFPGQIPTSCWRHGFMFATLHATDSDVTFYDGPQMHTVKAAKQVYNSTWIALLKNGFVLVKTWLLLECGTGFCAKIWFEQRHEKTCLCHMQSRRSETAAWISRFYLASSFESYLVGNSRRLVLSWRGSIDFKKLPRLVQHGVT